MPGRAAASAKIRVLCVDDNEDVTEMLGLCIAAEADMEIVGCLDAADDLLAEVKRTRADVVLLDLSMPGKDPLEALRGLAAPRGSGAGAGGRRGGGVRVVAYSGRNDQRAVDRAIAAGACGYVSKDAEIPSVLRAIREAARGNAAFGA